MTSSTVLVVTAFLVLMIPCDQTISAESNLASSQLNCSQPLGMEDGRISDAQITASSSYQETLVGPEKARLNTEAGGGAWCPSRVIDLDHSLEEWLEVNLGQKTRVTAVLVQGRYANGLGQEYAEHYALRYWSEDSEKWEQYRGGGEENGLVRGNNNTYQPLEHRLRGPPILTSRVRILPFSYHPRTVCMRLELKGCKFSNGTVILRTSNTAQTSSEEEWTERMFLALAASILVLVVLVTISAIVYAIVSNWRLKHYSTFYTGNDGASSLESSLKRGEDEIHTQQSIYMSGSNTSSSFEKRSVRPSDNYTRMQYYPGGVQYIR